MTQFYLCLKQCRGQAHHDRENYAHWGSYWRGIPPRWAILLVKMFQIMQASLQFGVPQSTITRGANGENFSYIVIKNSGSNLAW